jgi:iron-sulfur cluster assembly protein
MIQLTPKAVKAIKRFINYSETPVVGIRLLVSGGGCSGMQYGVRLENERSVDDNIIEIEGVMVFVDPDSKPLIDGLTIDFLETMTESGFKFDNPNATAACGCGKSFSI